MELVRQLETVGRWEDDNRVPEDERLTRWFPGYNVYTALMGAEVGQIRQRYAEIMQEV